MTPVVKTVLDAEMIRDGGSLTATFCDDNGAKWILFLPLDHVVRDNKFERLGFKLPFLIDADPTKRPRDTEDRIYSELSGPAHLLTWEEAQTLARQFTEFAAPLDKWATTSLARLRIAIDTRGALPPDMERFLEAWSPKLSS